MKPWPQSDKPQGLSGAADVWDANWAGPVLLDDYFPSAAPPADTLYKGANWAAYRVGSTADATLYLGTLTLHP